MKSGKIKEKLGRLRIPIYHERVRQSGMRFPGFDALATETILDLIFTTDIVNARLAVHFGRFRLSNTAHDILMILHLAPEYEFKMTELSQLLFVSRGNITYIVKNLERRRLITRRVAENDHRSQTIRITAAGKKLVQTIIPLLIGEQAIVGGLTDAEKSELRRLLDKIRRTLEDLS